MYFICLNFIAKIIVSKLDRNMEVKQSLHSAQTQSSVDLFVFDIFGLWLMCDCAPVQHLKEHQHWSSWVGGLKRSLQTLLQTESRVKSGCRGPFWIGFVVYSTKKHNEKVHLWEPPRQATSCLCESVSTVSCYWFPPPPPWVQLHVSRGGKLVNRQNDDETISPALPSADISCLAPLRKQFMSTFSACFRTHWHRTSWVWTSFVTTDESGEKMLLNAQRCGENVKALEWADGWISTLVSAANSFNTTRIRHQFEWTPNWVLHQIYETIYTFHREVHFGEYPAEGNVIDCDTF